MCIKYICHTDFKSSKNTDPFVCVCVHSCLCYFPSQGPLGRAGLPGADGLPGPPGTVLMLPVSHLQLLKTKS